MRSVIVYLQQAAEQEVVSFLERTYRFQKGPPWILDNDGDPVLYIDFYRDMNSEFEVEAYLLLTERLGNAPTVSVVADVSGRYPGDKEVYLFLSSLLSVFNGVVQDDYTDYFWKYEQIQNNETVQGHGFFDYEGQHTSM